MSESEDILTQVAARNVLARVATCACRMEAHEFARFLSRLQSELQLLGVPGAEATELWRQAVEGMSGPDSYGLERIGLWPTPKREIQP